MTPQTLLHRLAECLLRAGIRLAPGEAREWGNAMLGELHHIEGNRAAVAWALGGAGVLVKHALIALLLPVRSRQAAPTGNPLAREARMHKASLITGGVCLAAVSLFFLAPVFRQGFRVSLAQWHGVIHVSQSPSLRQPELESLARHAEKNQDAEGMAFVAVRLNDPAESVRLADEAVRLDPKLIWIWGVVGARHADAPGVPAWAHKLKQWDPGNALPYLILAEREDMERAVAGGGSFLHLLKPGTAWREAMAGAFNSNRINDYTGQLRAVDRAVASRYHISDPALVVGERTFLYRLPSYAGADSVRYAKLAIASGDALEASGDTKGAIAKYLQVARFLPLFHSRNVFSFFADGQMPGLYERLAGAYKSAGNGDESAYFTTLARRAKNEVEREHLLFRSEMENRYSIFGVTPWTALAVEASNFAMLASFCLLLIVLIVVLAKSRSLKPRKVRIGPVATGLGFLGSVGLLVSSVTLYVSYSPYAAIYSRFLQTGDTSQLKILSDFLAFTRTPIGTQAYRPSPVVGGHTMLVPYISTHAFTFYFWLAVTLLGVATLAAIGGKYLLKRRRPRTAAPANASVAG